MTDQEENNKVINMVENKVSKPIESTIAGKDVIKECRRVEMMSFFKSKNDEEKIEYVIGRADYEIVDWHHEMMTTKGKNVITYEKWKELAKAKFEVDKMTVGQLYRLTQDKTESVVDFIKRIQKASREFKIKEKDRVEIIVGGIRDGYEDIKRYLIVTGDLDEKEILKIGKMEKECEKEIKRAEELRALITTLTTLRVDERRQFTCYNCNEVGHLSRNCPKPKSAYKPKRTVNEIEEQISEVLNKENSIYIKGIKAPILFDSGAKYNFISQSVIEKFELESHKNTRDLDFWTCLDEHFKITRHVIINFTYGEKEYRARFYILPKVKRDKILLGRISLANMFKLEMQKYVCEIKTAPGRKIVEKIYNLPKKLEDQINIAIDNLKRKGYIRNSESTWLSNLRPVIKPDGTVRVTTNLVALNKIVELDRYSLPNMQEILYNLRDMAFFSKLDLKDGFFQIPLEERDRHKTAFRVKHRLYEWNVMPMGFKNAPAIFQRYMDNILKEEIGKTCFCYVDDILIFGKDEAKHDEAYKKIRKLLCDNGLQVNENKTVYKQREVAFLGHNIAFNEIRPKNTKLQGLDDLSAPKDKPQVQEFLGLINYYRKFVKDCSIIGEPLYDLLKNKNPFIWTEKEENAFKALKQNFRDEVTLFQPDFNISFKLETDASKHGIAGILTQNFNGEDKPIAFASRRLQVHEIKYSVSEKECLAMLWAMEHFQYFLYGTNFEIITDHRALEVLNKGDIKSDRIHRWLDRMAKFNYTITYRKGKDIPHVDCLSRNFKTEEVKNTLKTEEVENTFKIPISSEDLSVNEVKDMKVEPVDSEDNIDDVVRDVHLNLLHKGKKAMLYELTRRGYATNGLAPVITKVVKKCGICREYNSKKGKQFLFVKAQERGEKVAVDIVGPIENSYIITGIDYFTRQGFAKVIKSRHDNKVVDFLEEIYNVIPMKMLIMDQSKENLSNKVKAFCNSKNIILHHTAPFHHQSNGRVERFNRSLQDLIFKNKEDKLLTVKTKRAIDVYNDSYHSGINMTPLEAAQPERQQELILGQIEAIVKFKKSQENKGKEELFKLNDIVIIKQEGLVKKGTPKFKARGKVFKVLGGNTYLINVGNRLCKRHASQLKLIIDELSF